MTDDRNDTDHTAEAARRTRERDRMGRETPEPPLGARLGQIGILGWAIVTPMLLGVVLGRLADRHFETGTFFTAPAIMIGAGIGFHAAWKWMHRP
ncbi:AtpZ/AtpI family protein [Tropicimonas isoalkanivorans]|uniref:ATP synthase protein I n=1 Tax=Tropicimonas isoalkanivorans TaxID=441112 RepID=A0A1I1L2B4_9RHOB|nr:AtpZ/AtpI family protein [Tropicimonas isoalkanivorans]SFC67207.1 ATP synthase protein I [Tropicimonas isoalkanivorans]